MNRFFLLLSALLLITACQSIEPQTIATLSSNDPSIRGKEAYLNSPFVTAGDRVYMVGHQNGTFPELGWHIKGEMGGKVTQTNPKWRLQLQLSENATIEVKEGTSTDSSLVTNASNGLSIDCVVLD